jgi:uncharacterized protein YndB with AHSA1/START domain
MMSVKKDTNGRRYVALDVEVPGTPEQVWQAIATGPGIAAWFVPTDLEEREGGRVTFHLGPDMDSQGRVTTWEPARRFAYEEREWASNAPPLASEFTIEARAGGTCLVHVVHSLFASNDDWDDQLESIASGWPSFFEVLRLYLGRFFGLPCSAIRLTSTAATDEAEAWMALTRALGLEDTLEGQRPKARDAALPAFDGVVKRVGRSKHREMLVVLNEPADGAGMFGVYTWNKQVMASVSLYLYGERAADVVRRDEPRWREWLHRELSPVLRPS